jgi:hypothetical protein
MKKHPATWLLAVLVALGAGQAGALSSLKVSREACALVQDAKVRRDQHRRRERAILGFPNRESRIFDIHNFARVIRNSSSARFLRAPPLFSTI